MQEVGSERHSTALWACDVPLDEPGAPEEAVEQSPSLSTLLIFTIVLCSCGAKVVFGLVRDAVSEVCHFKCKMGADSLGMGMYCPVRSISKDAGTAVCRGHQSLIPLCSPAAQGLKKLKENTLRKGLWRPGGSAGVSKVWDFARRALQFLQ